MGETRLRYAASGPFVTNEEGGPVEPGEGFQIRSVFVAAATGNAIAAANNATPITSTVAVLDNIKLNCRYRAAMELHLEKTLLWTATGTVQYAFQYSADSGTSWTTWATQTITYGGQAAHTIDDDASLYAQTLPVLGSALTGVEEGGVLRVRVLKVLSGGVNNGIVYNGAPAYVLQFIEEL